MQKQKNFATVSKILELFSSTQFQQNVSFSTKFDLEQQIDGRFALDYSSIE